MIQQCIPMTSCFPSSDGFAFEVSAIDVPHFASSSFELKFAACMAGKAGTPSGSAVNHSVSQYETWRRHATSSTDATFSSALPQHRVLIEAEIDVLFLYLRFAVCFLCVILKFRPWPRRPAAAEKLPPGFLKHLASYMIATLPHCKYGYCMVLQSSRSLRQE